MIKYICPDCDGDKTIYIEPDPEDYGPPLCAGLVKCDTCNGRGYVTVKDLTKGLVRVDDTNRRQ